MVCLIKPQFETTKEKVGKKGVVRDPKVHEEVVLEILQFAVETGFEILGLDFSPIRGPEGNIEYLLYMRNSKHEGAERADTLVSQARAVVNKSHEKLEG